MRCISKTFLLAASGILIMLLMIDIKSNIEEFQKASLREEFRPYRQVIENSTYVDEVFCVSSDELYKCIEGELLSEEVIVEEVKKDCAQVQVIQQKQRQIDTAQITEQMLEVADSCIGTPYVWGGETKGVGMDCSGFVQYVYKELGLLLPRTSAVQSKVGRLVKRTELKVGDLLFFDTENDRDKSNIKTPEEECTYAKLVAEDLAPNPVSHVGIYVGDGMMIHAASGSGYVRYESIDSDYYRCRFINARRLIKDE